MEYSGLYELIKQIQYGTKLHIGVCFFGKDYSEKLEIPQDHTIHSSVVCDEFKIYKGSFPKCFRCRNMALKKAVDTRTSFGGLCINGVYEYTRPVVADDTVVCVIFIGNILDDGKGREKLRTKLGDREYLMFEMEENFGIEKCESAADLLESYIRLLMEKYPKASESRRTARLIENIKSYAEANMEFGIDLGHMAQMFHYNERYLGRLFKAETNRSFNDYLNDIRLKRAAHMLKNSDETVIWISNKVGFNNVTYFNRLFKRTYGQTPTEYRLKKQP